jgi:Ser/Thr protein kinase RdoA (MazF antagonist)
MAMETVPPAVLARWSSLREGTVERFGTGLINDTYRVEGRDGAAYIVQRLHPVFSPAIHDDIHAVTEHLRARGLTTPTLVATDDGARWVEHPRADGATGVWRVMTFVPDSVTWDRVPSIHVAREAGSLVASFHCALVDLKHTYVGRKGRPHDTTRHVAMLEESLDAYRSHRLYEEVVSLARPLLEVLRPLPDFAHLPSRHAHGDLKLSNLLFTPEGRGLCLVDLDTVGPMPWPHEMGDALRSWCNPAGEDTVGAHFDTTLFEAAVEGYAARVGATVTATEWRHLVDGVLVICRELAVRFLVDALREQYFGWDASRYATRGEHNLVRARGQWALAESVRCQRSALDTVVSRVVKNLG